MRVWVCADIRAYCIGSRCDIRQWLDALQRYMQTSAPGQLAEDWGEEGGRGEGADGEKERRKERINCGHDGAG